MNRNKDTQFVICAGESPPPHPTPKLQDPLNIVYRLTYTPIHRLTYTPIQRLTYTVHSPGDWWSRESSEDIVNAGEAGGDGGSDGLTTTLTPHQDFACLGHGCGHMGVVGGGHLDKPVTATTSCFTAQKQPKNEVLDDFLLISAK